MGAMLDYMQSILPPWLAKGPLIKIGGKLYQRTMAAFGQVGDELRGDAAFGVREAMLEECTPDAYPAHLRNSNLQVISGEAPARQLAELRRRWLTAREGGGYDGMLYNLARIGYPSAEVKATLDLKIDGEINPFGSRRNFFFVRVNQPNIWEPGEIWDGGKEWDDGTLWDLSGGTHADLYLLLYTIQKWKPYTHSCRYVEIETKGGDVRSIPMHEIWEEVGAWFYNRTFSTP